MANKMNIRVLVLFVFIVFMHLIFSQSLQLHFDEAYYWVWSKNLQLSYFDHPPMIAYLIRLTTLFSDQELFVRLTSVLCSTVTVIMIYKTAKTAFGQKAGDLAVIFALAWPLLEGNFFITTIDNPLLMFWSVAIYCLMRGLVLDEKKYIYAAGIAIGCDLLSKYTAVLILPGVLVYLLLSSKHRVELIRKDVYGALILAVLVFSPVIIWNYQHNWISFVYQFKHGVSETRQINFAGFGDYIGAFFGAANPFISIPIFVFIWLKRKLILKDDRYLLLLSIFAFVSVFFAYNSLYKFMEANWVAPAYISAIVFLAGCMADTNIKWVHRTAIGLILFLLPIIKMPDVFVPRQFQSKIPSINAFMGNKQLYQQIKTNYIQPGDVILACDYGNASRGWYYLGLGRTYVLSNFKFSNTYADWNSSLNLPIKNAIYFCDGNDDNYLKQLAVYFTHIEPAGIVKYHDSFVDNKLYVYRLSN